MDKKWWIIIGVLLIAIIIVFTSIKIIEGRTIRAFNKDAYHILKCVRYLESECPKFEEWGNDVCNQYCWKSYSKYGGEFKLKYGGKLLLHGVNYNDELYDCRFNQETQRYDEECLDNWIAFAKEKFPYVIE